VLAISTDSVYTHKILNEIELSKMVEGGVPFPILADDTGSIGKAYEVFDEKLGTTLRGTFIIDPNGYVHGMEILTTPAGRSVSEILRQLKAFQTYISTKQLIPADWNPGDITLPEEIGNVGNIWTLWKPKKTE
jgi:peroxiredoxin (alkyl hydroperoxide reductase subunit C)